MSKQKAVYYGQVQIIPAVFGDGYVLNDGLSVMSERGTAIILNMDHKTLEAVGGNWPPKTLKPFSDNDLTVGGNYAEVVARNSPHYGREIVVYDTKTIQGLISAYALAYINGGLRKNQLHIGKRCVALSIALVTTALDAAIKEACGFIPDVQQTARQHYTNAVELIHEFGFKCSVDNRIATKKDIVAFLDVPVGTLNSFLYKHSYEIKPVKLDASTIRSIGSRANRMYGYSLDDVVKIVFGMDTEVTAALKKKMFGDLGTFAKMESKGEIQWREVLRKVFAGFTLHCNYAIGKYRYYVDYFIPELALCLECNGYDGHRSYDAKQEQQREQVITQQYALIRFHYQTSLETLVNAILHAKPGQVIRLYADCRENLASCN